MKAEQLAECAGLSMFNKGEDKQITKVYCCDLLSFVMGRAPEGCAWVTVMGNVNSAAVSVLADIGAIILADGVKPDENLLSKSADEGIMLLGSKEPIFETALRIHEALKNG